MAVTQRWPLGRRPGRRGWQQKCVLAPCGPRLALSRVPLHRERPQGLSRACPLQLGRGALCKTRS